MLAASRVFEVGFRDWRLCDLSLRELAARLPGHDEAAALVKAAAVNSLYGTNVYAVVRMARHVSRVLRGADLGSAGPELVEVMARVESLRGARVSFASKYAHFFIDQERFPIYDSVAVEMLRRHDGGGPVASYPDFVRRFDSLFDSLQLAGSRRQLDRYLWLAGLGLRLAKDPQAPVNAEVRAYYANNPRPPFLPKLDAD